MGLPIQDVERVKEEFEKDYFDTAPYDEYVNMCAISKVGICDKNAPANEKNDFCISIGLREPLPENLPIPSEYKGVKVFVTHIGENYFA